MQRRWITVALVLVIAFLSGHLMQANRVQTTVIQPEPTPVDLPTQPVTAAALVMPPSLEKRILETQAPRKGGCRADLILEETPGGFLSVLFDAPCHPNTQLTLKVNTLVASDMTDARGRWEKRLPTLSDISEVEIKLGDLIVSDRLLHENARDQQHIILAWTGAQTFRIRVDPWSGDAATSAPDPLTEDGATGTFTRVGDASGFAFEIYTFPAAVSGATGVLRVLVDAEVSAGNCGQTATTRAYQTGYLGRLRPTEIAYTMPECDRIGDVVRLQNLFRDLRLAQR